MAYNRDRAFESEDGIILNDTVHVVGGAGAPSASFPAPSGATIYIQDNGTYWYWNGTNWLVLDAYGYHSGFTEIESGQTVIVKSKRQMYIKGVLLVDGILTIDGRLVND